LTTPSAASTVRHPHRCCGPSTGNRVSEGPGETRPETGPAREDRGTPGARRANAGSGAAVRIGSPR
jgi:hypothetical protein